MVSINEVLLEQREQRNRRLELELEGNRQKEDFIVKNLIEIFNKPLEEVKSSYTMLVRNPYASWWENHKSVSKKLLKNERECCKLRRHLLNYLESETKENKEEILPYCLGYIWHRFGSIKLCDDCRKMEKEIVLV